MSERTLKRWVGALTLAIIAWAVSTLFSRGAGSISASGEITRSFEGVVASSIEAIRIEGPEGRIELLREGDTWTANGFSGDAGSIGRLLGVMSDLRVGDLVATNPANHNRMGVSADSAVTVDFEVDGRSRSILVGKQGPRFGTSYVRLPGADEVYLLEGDLRIQVVRMPDDWRDRTMVMVDSAIVQRLVVERDGSQYTLVRGDSVWAFETGGLANPTAVNGILSELSNLVATGFLGEGDSIASLGQVGVTRAYSESDEAVAEIFIGDGVADRWAKTASNGYIYRVSSFRANRVVPTRSEAEPGS